MSVLSRRKVTLSVEGSLVEEAKAGGINLSRTLEKALHGAWRDLRRERWEAANAEALACRRAEIARGDWDDWLALGETGLEGAPEG